MALPEIGLEIGGEPVEIGLVPNPCRHGVAGLGAALTFLAYIAKFGERVQTRGASGYSDSSLHRTYPSAHPQGRLRQQQQQQQPSGLFQLMTLRWGILAKTCSTREVLTGLSLAICLLMRTGASVWVARRWGKIVRSVVSLNFQSLKQQVVQFAGATVLLSLLNALLKFQISVLQLELREKITRWCHQMYMRPKELVYYKVNRLGDARLAQCAHQMTSDIERFSEAFTHIISQSIKPISDFLVYSVEISRVSGLVTPLSLYAWFALASSVSTLALPPFGDLAATEQELEGEFLQQHSKLVSNCEAVAFLGGEEPEQRVLDKQLDKVLSHGWLTTNLSLKFEIVRQYLNKYMVTVIGLFLISRPLRLRHLPQGGAGGSAAVAFKSEEVAQYFTSTWRNMEALATSIKELFEMTTHLGRLSGFAKRLNMLMQSLEAHPPVLTAEIQAGEKSDHPPRFIEGQQRTGRLRGENGSAGEDEGSPSSSTSILEFSHVTVYKPDGSLLVKDLSLSIKRGERILVTGGNGAGKSSLFRVMRKLWPLAQGTIVMPAEEHVHFVTQAEFVPAGTLREIIIYPDTPDDMKIKARTDMDIHMCLLWAHVSPKNVVNGRAQLEFTLGQKIVRPALDEEHDWERLSPGQKQRLAFARLFYHRPHFAILDECTNGVSPDVEHDLYDRCKRLNMGIISIAHKMELKLFHDRELRFSGDPDGSWSIEACSDVEGQITRASATIRRPEPDENGKMDSKIVYERHVWYFG